MHEVVDATVAGAERLRGGTVAGKWLTGLVPLLLLAALVALFLRVGPIGLGAAAFPPVEELTIERVALPAPGLMDIHVVNGGPEPVTVAQVLVDDALWAHELDGSRTIGRLERRRIRVPYPWVQGEPHEVALLTSTGLTFSAEVPVAVQTPRADVAQVLGFGLLGVYVGVIPVFLGLLWLPFLRRLSDRWTGFFLALTLGLLAFLGLEALSEALETAAVVPGAFQGLGLVALGFLGTVLLLAGVSGARGEHARDLSPMAVALLVALGIGLHNLGEGLVIGTSYATGEIALGAFLVIGFLIHNTTEGLAIVAPIARGRPTLRRLAGLGLLAGAPTILGAWIGGFTYSSALITLFFAVGAGAVAQVVWQLWRMFARRPAGLTAPLNAAGVLAGLLLMYVTGLTIAA